MQKSFAFLYTEIEHPEKEITKTIPFAIAYNRFRNELNQGGKRLVQ